MDFQSQDAGIRFVHYSLDFFKNVMFQNTELNFALLLSCSDHKPEALEPVHIDIYI